MLKALNAHELRFIEEAASFLEKPSSLVSATDWLGKPLDKLQNYLPENLEQMVKNAVKRALKTALQVAVQSLPQQKIIPISLSAALHANQRSAWKHTAAVTTTGALSGVLGSASMMVELPVTTSLILRSIASTAQQWGHDLSQAEIQMQCLYVFTMGSAQTNRDDEMDSAYISARLAYHGLIREMAGFVSSHSLKEVFLVLEKGTLPALVKFASLLLPSLERTLVRSILSKAVPIVSAVGSAALNAGFCQYFTKAARFHFGLMHLEDVHGRELVHAHYNWARHPERVWPEIRLIS